MDIISALQRTFNLILAVLEPLIEADVLAGFILVMVLLVVWGRGE